MNEWMNERMDGWTVDEWMDDWMDGRMMNG